MATIARLIGGAGTGKTTELLNLLGQVLERGISPLDVGFVSFTRAARREASSRAAELTGFSVSQLETEGWFRTLHSVAYRGLGCSQAAVLADDSKTSKWIAENLNEPGGMVLGNVDEDLAEAEFTGMTDTGRALALWQAARSRLEPLQASWDSLSQVSDKTPSMAFVRDVVTRYEQAKRLDDRMDFADLLGRFAGWRFGIDGHTKCEPEGDVPPLPVWFFDEQQDTSALLDAVCHRLITAAEWVYVVGDVFQSIYSWSGADARLFMAWDVAKQRIMPKSYRCPQPIHELGERILRESSDYWDRGIAPADHPGEIDVLRFSSALINEIDPSQSWLLLARTNYHASRIAAILRSTGIPWQPTRGPGGWNRPAKNKVFNALFDANAGYPIEGKEWGEILKHLPCKLGEVELLQRGTKTNWKAEQHKNECSYARDLEKWGATPALIDLLLSPKWVELLDGAWNYAHARQQYGYEVVTNPPVRLGTIHSAKGAEADNVMWLTTGSKAIARACEYQQGGDDECKVSYVAATRAKRRLVVAVEPNERFRYRVPL